MGAISSATNWVGPQKGFAVFFAITTYPKILGNSIASWDDNTTQSSVIHLTSRRRIRRCAMHIEKSTQAAIGAMGLGPHLRSAFLISPKRRQMAKPPDT